MDERYNAKANVKQRAEIVQGIVGIGLIILIIFVTYLFYGKHTIKGDRQNINISIEKDLLVYESNTLQSYITKIKELENSANVNEETKKINAELLKTLNDKSTAPITENKPFDISKSYNAQTYKKDFLNALSVATSSGAGLELLYFVSQVNAENNEILPLSPKDIENVYNIASKYENFADTVQKLKTPEDFLDNAVITIQKSREIAFLLKQMMLEKDSFIYAHLFSKYSEASGYIFREKKQSI